MIVEIFGKYFNKDFLINELEFVWTNGYGDTLAHFKNNKDVYWWREYSAKQIIEEINKQLASIKE